MSARERKRVWIHFCSPLYIYAYSFDFIYVFIKAGLFSLGKVWQGIVNIVIVLSL